MLVLDYGFDPADIERHVADLAVVRFANQALADPISRVARDPIRKLGPDERLVGLFHRLNRRGLPTDAVCRAIAAALCYRDENDHQSRELADLIRKGGPELVLQEICGIGPGQPGFDIIIPISGTRNREERIMTDVRIYLDCAEIDKIKDAVSTGLVDGIATNPNKIAQSGKTLPQGAG